MPKTKKITVTVAEARSIGFQTLRFELSEEIEIEEGDKPGDVKREAAERLTKQVDACLTSEEPRLCHIAAKAARWKERL